MTDEIIAFKGEVWLLSWRESHNNGATVTFQLADVEDLDAFKRMTVRKGKRAGQRLACVLVEIGEDEQPVVQEKKGGPLSKSAAQMCENELFRKFLRESYPTNWKQFLYGSTTLNSADVAASVVRQLCGVTSRADLDHNHEAAKRFHELMREFNQWQSDSKRYDI